MRGQSPAGALAATSTSTSQSSNCFSRALRGALPSKVEPQDGSLRRKKAQSFSGRSIAANSLQPFSELAPSVPRPLKLTSQHPWSLPYQQGGGRSTSATSTSSFASSCRVAASLWERKAKGGGLLGVGRNPLDLLKLASPVLGAEASRRRQKHASIARALLDKSQGSSSPGSGGDKGKPPQKVGTTAIPAASSNAAESARTADAPNRLGSDSTAREALERLFAQAQLYEQRAGDPEFATEEELEAVVKQLEADLGQVLGMLRTKEEELGRAEARLEEEREEVEEARAVLVQREKQLEAVRVEQVGRQDELQSAKHALREQRHETERVTAELRAREREVMQQREDVKRKAREVQMANVQLAEQKGVLLELETVLAKKQRELGEALEEREAQRKELVALQGLLSRQREEHSALRHDLEAKRQRLGSVEMDLSLRTQAFAAARAEIQALRTQLQGLAGDNHDTSLELQHAQKLLAEVQDELRASNSAVLQFQAEVAEEEANGLRLEAEISRLGALLQTRERELAASMGRRQKEALELQKTQREFGMVQQRVLELEKEAEERRVELQEEKDRVAALTEELTTLKKEARQQTAALSDVQLSLQVKQAELLTTRLEVQQLRSDLSAAHVVVKNKTEELESAQRSVSGLRSELGVVRRQLADKEAQLASLGAAIKEKDQAISVLQMDADSSRLKLSEAEHALEQIAQLSRMLAEMARQGEASSTDGSLADSLSRAALLAAKPQSAQELQQALLSRANEDLFAANSALLDLDIRHHKLQEVVEDQNQARCSLRAELEAVQECLREREAELESTREELLAREMQLAAMVRQWETREQEINSMRFEVMEGAREIAALRDQARASGLGKGWVKGSGGAEEEGAERVDSMYADEAAITKLELEVVKLEADSAIAALKALSDLSSELKEGCKQDLRATVVNSPSHTASLQGPPASSGAEVEVRALAVERMEEQLREKDAALSMAKHAMENLAELTRRLVVEASSAMNASLASGLGSC